MNRKQKIVVSITGIFLVLMILVGLTYAYFLTKITGNTNTKSISVSTANLVLKYGEETQDIITKEALMPGETAAVKVFSATNEGNSTVTYGASLENITYTNLENNTSIDSLDRQEDLVYTLECKQYLKTGFTLSSNGTVTGTEDGTCNGKTETIFPTKINISLMVVNTVDTNHAQVYTLTIFYKDVNLDQSNDMNKKFEARVNIIDLKADSDKLNPYSNQNALNYNIINNAINATGTKTRLGGATTSFSDISLTSFSNGEEKKIDEALLNSAIITYADTEELALTSTTYIDGVTCENLIGKYLHRIDIDTISKVTKCSNNIPVAISKDYERVLNTAPDDYGNSYYYRGDIKDNYVSFAGFTWRIVRINGDGSIRIVLNNALDTLYLYNTNSGDNAYIGYMHGTPESASYDETHKNITSSNAKTVLDTWYETNIENSSNNKKYEQFLSDTLFCGDKEVSSGSGIGTQATKYKATERLSNVTIANPTFECAKGAKNNYSRYTSKLETDTTTVKGVSVNNDLTHPIALLTADEIVYAGGFNGKANSKNYLNYSISLAFVTMTPSNNDYLYSVISDTSLQGNFVSLSGKVSAQLRPVINLKATVLIASGDGTEKNPYTVKLS